ncbi:MAG: efflux transporter outer membrane subunit [Bdellovibrionales bacterium]
MNTLSCASVFAMASVLLGSCAAGPDFTPPDAPDVMSYDYKPLANSTADGAQDLQIGQDIPAEWWTLFHSKELNKLVIKAIKENPDLASAEAALRVAQDNLSAGSAAFFPAASGTFASQRVKTSKDAGGGRSIYTLHSATVGVSYDLDLWGGTRRSVEKLQAEAAAAQFEKEAAYLALTSNVVTLAITEASLREQIAAVEEIVAAQKKVLDVFKLRFNSGAVAKSAVVAQESALASAEADMPPLQHQLAVTRHALSALIGQMPSNQPEHEFKLSAMSLPKKIPLSLPSRLVAQRPDVRAAEEQLHAASAAIGIAQAARLPKITLSADIGSMAKTFSKLLTPGYGLWDFGASAAQSLFDAGALANKEQAARDAFDIAAAQYRKTVLAAFREVADALHALQSDAESLTLKRNAEKAANENLTLTQAQYNAGAVGMAEFLLAQQSSQQARAAAVKAEAQRYADTAALFAALGGGWWNRDAGKTQPVAAGSDVKIKDDGGNSAEPAPLSTSNLGRRSL